MDLCLKGRKALVTGASYGLGYACARMLAAEGVNVALNARDAEKLQLASTCIETDFGVQTAAVAADLTQTESYDKIEAACKKAFEHIDILVISTGHPPTYPFSAATDTQWQTGYDLILQPAIQLSRRFLPPEKGYGRIIFIGSIFGLEPEASSVIQSTFRTGLNALSKCIATENAAHGVTANVICPGYFETPLVTNLAGQYAQQQKKDTADVLEDWKSYAPVREFGDPDDLGRLVAFLSSPRAAFMTGTSVTFDGGAVRQY
jgi:3-oxoacyl-[acyl-carrier protein] reductase